ncbi:M43 family zinc metalloprotease [Filimonas effusa]|nr:M43 family zinc metalloprotease [Filimonas effusa]
MPSYKQVLCGLALLLYSAAFAQSSESADTIIRRRCATMEVLNKMITQNPSLPQQWQREGEIKYQQYLQRGSTAVAARTTGSAPYRVSGNEIVIPVVVHIVLANPNTVTDRDVQEQIEILNIDFAGLNKDSAVISPEFKARFGHTRIRFALARTDASGNFTTGIDRKISSTSYTQNTYDRVKRLTTGGVDAWDVNRYYNIWVTQFSDGILGVSTFPYMTPAAEQGTVVNYRSFGTNPAYVNPQFCLGRTLVHETGHFFYLYHIWGDDNGACTGSDFTTTTGYPLPSSCTDDTPGQGNSSSGFLGGYITDNCTSINPGINYQNYMDYTNDVSYGMFTQSQVCRMEAALNTYRSTLASSAVDFPPSGITDLCLAALTPGNRQGVVTQAVCNGTAVKALIRNQSSTTLTSATFNLQYDNGAITTIPWTGNLEAGADVTITLGTISIATGSHTLKVYTTAPNGTTDSYIANDTLTRQFYITGDAVTAPYTESFETTTFPSNGWQLSNPDNSTTWQRSSLAAYAGAASARIGNYSQSSTAGQWDDLISPPIRFSADADSVKMSFRVAYRAISNTPGSYFDGLEIWVSGGCGSDFRPVYRKASPDISSVNGITSGSFTPTASQWRLDSIDLTPYRRAGENMIVLFRNINGAGNNIYLDDIRFTQTALWSSDAQIAAVSAKTFTCSGTTLQAGVAIRNNGHDALRSASIHYKVDTTGTEQVFNWTGNLATGDTALVTLPDITSSIGQHSLIARVSNPNGQTDQNPGNDTARAPFIIFGTVNAPLTEGFETNTFPPTGWGVNNPDNNTTWTRSRKATTLLQTNDIAAAVMPNFGYNPGNVTDELISPVVRYNNVDSVFLLFDVAALYSAITAVSDTLQVLVTTDCGTSYQTVYSKTGVFLATQTGSNATAFLPETSGGYRRDSINLTDIVPAGSGSFQVSFRNISSGRNNIYIDNINIKTKTLPAALKEKGYLLYPNPTRSTVVIQHYLAPATLKGIYITDMAGRILYRESYTTGQAPAYKVVDMTSYASGIYLVRLIYTDNVITEKIIKQ